MIEDILYSRLREYQERIERARENITRALRVSKKPAVCISAGKDSTVLLSLVLEQKKDALAVFYDSGFEYPETYETLEKLEKHFGIEILIIETSYTMQEIIELEKELGGISPSFVKNVLVYEPSLYVRDEYGVDMFFVGLRAEESKQRKLAVLRKMPFYFNKRFQYYLAYPIGHLKVEDVFAYIYSNKLPIHPFYEMNLPLERNKRRIGVIGGTAASTIGRQYWLKLSHPEMFEKLCELDPSVLFFA